jgi:hypothetical protein
MYITVISFLVIYANFVVWKEKNIIYIYVKMEERALDSRYVLSNIHKEQQCKQLRYVLQGYLCII